ncbi:MAG: hypothetical protein WCD18_26925 [Thermosynechococcaceae cyanobacterium]
MANLTPEELLAGAAISVDVVIPSHLLHPGHPHSSLGEAQGKGVQLRPLSIGTFQLIMKAAKSDASLIPLLMIKESMVEPTLSLDQIKGLPLGLVSFLIEQIRYISGFTEKKSPLMS